MNRFWALSALALLLSGLHLGGAHAALPLGAKAPAFAARGALNGRLMPFDLDRALRRGPVVLYFFPKAFTPGCSLEAKLFAAAIADFKQAGASVVGVSTDSVEELQRFSKADCAGAFPVVKASSAALTGFDVALRKDGVATGLAERTSYVIGQDRRIRFVHSGADPREHVARTLSTVRDMR